MSRYQGLLDGAARFAADLRAAGALHLHLVRSPYAHALIRGIRTDEARSHPGVIGVHTAADLDLEPIWEIEIIPPVFAQPVLATGVVRHVGERVVAVVAETPAAALDAAELIEVDYEPLPAVVTPADALDAPPVFTTHGSNVALEWSFEAGEPAGTPADVVVGGVVTMPRVAVAPMEGLSVVAVPEVDGRITMHTSTQSPGHTRTQTARSLRIDAGRIRVLVPSVGGGFGGKALGGIGEYVLAAALAQRHGRPVRYHEDRGANLTTMHGRGMRLEYRLHVDDGGRIRSLAVDELCDAGAYPQTNSVEPGKTLLMLCGPYRVPAVSFRARSVVTNLVAPGAYRGPGRSESTAVLERALDRAAARLGLDPVEVRRRNLLRADELPCVTVTDAHYDRVDHHLVLSELLDRAGYDALRAEQRQRLGGAGGSPIGIGIATVVDSSAWFARTEPARVLVDESGAVRVLTATASAGQSHGVVLAQIVGEVLGMEPDAIEVLEGDTDELTGSGSSGSRTAQLAGTAARFAALELRDRLVRSAAELLEAAPADIVVEAGRCHVRGAPARAVPFVELARRASQHGVDLDAQCVFDQPAPTYPAGAHLSVVEVDPETGRVRPLRHVAVTDCGVVLDEPGARGQVVGASAQGIAQALYEVAAFDEAGTPLNPSLAEYLVPSAAEVPPIEAHFVETPASANPLGARGVGEIGMVAAPAAVWNAVLDALAPFGVDHVELPCTPERVWRAVRGSTS